MNKEELTYIVIMKLLRKMLEQGLVSKDEYCQMDTKMKKKYHPKIGSLLCEKFLL